MIIRAVRPGILRAALPALAAAVVAWASAGEASAQPNQASREAQTKLVAGLTPVKTKVRFRRDLNPPKPAPLSEDAAPRDYTNTPEGRAGAAELEKVKRNTAGSDWPPEAPPGKERVIYAGDDRKESEIEYDLAELAALAKSAMARGINNATEGGETGTPPATQADLGAWSSGLGQILSGLGLGTTLYSGASGLGEGGDEVLQGLVELAGWSSGTDSRVMKSISTTYPIKHRVLMRIGELNGGGCSGALIGRRLVLTAAHCIVRADLSYNVHAYRARRSGSQMPFGTANSVGYWYASKWVSNNCHTNRRFDPCSQHDWAILLLPDTAWNASPNGTPGWMGYWVYGQTYIQQNAVSRNDGYPACGFQGAPVGCQMGQPYGQNAGCTARGFLWPHDGIPSYYRLGCDISGGHSGSPNWTDYPGSNGPYAIGIAMWEHCFGNTCSSQPGDYATHPNGFRGMTPYLANLITDKRVAYP